MKKIPILFIPFIAVSLLVACNNSGGTSGKPYLNQEYYAIGYGHFIDGGNWKNDSGYKFNKKTTNQSEIYYLYDVDFSVGDAFKIVNKDHTLTIKDHFLTSEGSFKSNNVTLYESNENELEINVLKTGKYNLSFTVSEDNYSFSITNGSGTEGNEQRIRPQNKVYLDVFSHGDQHGITEKTKYYDHYLPSIPTFISHVKEKMKATPNSDILINQGDLWQGTYASNFNYGAMLNEVLEYAEYDAFNIGNHEFDWGEEEIAINQANCNVPYISSNIKLLANNKLADYVQPYTIVERDGLYIGIIGSIGSSQITSINSNNVKNVTFDSHLECTKKTSDRLRNEFDCDIVIGCMHEGSTGVRACLDSLSQVSSVSGKRYLDAAFASHDHSAARGVINNVPYLNSGNNLRYLSHMTLTYNKGTVSYTTYENTYATDLENEEDAGARAIVDKYCDDDVKAKGASVVGRIDNQFSSSCEAPRLMAKAMYEYAQGQGYNVDLAIVNYGRAHMYPGDVTYSQLLDVFPFFNKTVIMDVKGSDLISCANRNFYYSANSSQKFVESKTYKIALYDYLAYHQSSNRKYDYFSSSYPFHVYAELKKHPCDIASDYMKKQSGVILIADYQTKNFTFIN